MIKGYLEEMGYTCTEFAFTDSNDVASVTQSAADASDVIYIPTDNTAAAYTETIANVVIPAKVPVVAGEEGICKGCGVATLTISYYDLGYKTGEMAYDILANGADVSTMEVASAPNFTKKYNAAERRGARPDHPGGLRGHRVTDFNVFHEPRKRQCAPLASCSISGKKKGGQSGGDCQAV